MSAIRYHATILPGPDELADAWAQYAPLPSTTPFQSLVWLTRWYEGFAGTDGIEPVIVQVLEKASGDLAYFLPLIRRKEGGRTQIEFADRGVTDYNLPVLGPKAPESLEDCQAAWQAASAALPAADLIVFTKMPAMIGARGNPLMQAIGGEKSHLIGSHLVMTDNYGDWLQAIGRHNRKEFGRFWRVFERAESARFLKASTIEDANRILHWIESRQNDRAERLGLGTDEYRLDLPQYRDFYRNLVQQGLDDGTVIVTALVAGDEIVAGLYALSDGTHYAMVRIAIAEGEWTNCSPGRLVIERSMAALHAEGYRWFDFTTGDYAYKRTFRTTHVALHDVTIARSLRGLPQAGLARTKAFVKRHPKLENLARRLMGRPLPGSQGSTESADKQAA